MARELDDKDVAKGRDELVCLAVGVVPWHSFNLVGFGPVNLQTRHPKYQGNRREAGCSASIAAVPIFRARPSRLLRIANTVPVKGATMKNPMLVAELHRKLGAPSSEAVENLRLLKAFLKLPPRQRFEVIDMVERLASDPSPVSDRPLS